MRGAAIALGVLVGLAPPPAMAHPHAWIDLRTSVVLDPKGRVVAIEQEWLLDPLYSALLIEDLGDSTAALRAHGAGMLERLRVHDYFTQVRVDGQVQTPGTVHEFGTELRSNRYWIRFVMPLGAPADPTVQDLSYSVFDPTYYIEILHLEEDVIEFLGVEPGRCEARIEPPQPTTEAIMRARSPAVDARPDSSLGALFAERVQRAFQVGSRRKRANGQCSPDDALAGTGRRDHHGAGGRRREVRRPSRDGDARRDRFG